MPKKPATKESFEKQFQELETIVAKLEAGTTNLDESLEQFKRGLELAQDLKQKLTEVENRVEIIKKRFSKDFETKPGEEPGEDEEV
ncbi:MAG: exodeoxyribonuclease VII small subunit [Patescibacteria group bacterium]|nr:exodeoxyribonuclease VII small subunit [Patescibacteria group bacterium]